MDKRELGKALRESQWVPEGIEVRWSRNSINGLQRGIDVAWSLPEAYKLAEARAGSGGLPAAASIYHNGTEVRRYILDHSARLFYIEGETLEKNNAFTV